MHQFNVMKEFQIIHWKTDFCCCCCKREASIGFTWLECSSIHELFPHDLPLFFLFFLSLWWFNPVCDTNITLWLLMVVLLNYISVSAELLSYLPEHKRKKCFKMILNSISLFDRDLVLQTLISEMYSTRLTHFHLQSLHKTTNQPLNKTFNAPSNPPLALPTKLLCLACPVSSVFPYFT